MKITRHLNFIDNPTRPVKQVLTFDPPFDIGSTLGAVSAIYADVDFAHGKNRNRLEKIAPIVNKNGILHLRELMKSGEVLSVELRIGYCLRNVTLDSSHSLQLLAVEKGLLYWISIGRDGYLEVTGQVVKDDDGDFRKLKASLTDTAMRVYLVKRALADPKVTQEAVEALPNVMTHAQAAKYLQLSPKTLYNLREIPRLKHNRYRKEDLDRYLQGKRK